jgi:hypothetical protein
MLHPSEPRYATVWRMPDVEPAYGIDGHTMDEFARTRTHRDENVRISVTLKRREDHAHQQPSLTKKKLRRLEITAGAPKHTKSASGIWSANDAIRDAERELARQAETSYKRMVQDQRAGAPARKVGASATPERA